MAQDQQLGLRAELPQLQPSRAMNRLRGNEASALGFGRRGRGHEETEGQIDPETLVDEAWDLWEEGASKEAYAKLEQIPRAARDGIAYLALMSFLCDEFDLPRRRLKVLRQLVETDPTVDIHWAALGHAARRVKGHAAAVRIWLRALRQEPMFVPVRWSLAQHYCALGRLRAAREQLKLALFLDLDLVSAAMDEPVFAAILETAAEADPPPPEEGEEWKGSGCFA